MSCDNSVYKDYLSNLDVAGDYTEPNKFVVFAFFPGYISSELVFKVTDKFKNVYEGTVLTDGTGKINSQTFDTSNASIFPSGLFTKDAGEFTIEFFDSESRNKLNFIMGESKTEIKLEIRTGTESKDYIGLPIQPA